MLPATSHKALGFQEFPFSVSADPRYLYLSPQHLLVLDTVQRIIDGRQGLAVIEGVIGVGKSSLARRLHDLYSQGPYLPLYIHTASYKSSYEALTDFAEKFGLPRRRSETAVRNSLEEWLVAQRRDGRVPILITDDAQMLGKGSLDAFQHMYNFDVRQKLIQVVLVGQTELRAVLAHNAGLLSRIVSWQTILPLPYGEALAMINFRCQVAGRREPLLDESAFTQLYDFTGGLPRTMVVICSALLDIMRRDDKSTADSAAVEEAIEDYSQRPLFELDGGRAA